MSAKHTVKSFFTFKWNPCKLATMVVKETGGKTYTATGSDIDSRAVIGL